MTRSTVVCGLGIDTLALLRCEQSPLGGGAVIVAVDDPATLTSAVRREMDQLEIAVCSVQSLTETFDAIDVDRVIRSPGFPSRNPLLKRFVSNGVGCTTPLGLWLEQNPEIRTIGITGTKGKSTTTTFVYACLLKLGFSAHIAGNIGTPIWDIAPEIAVDDVVVLEVSSYMAADLGAHPTVGVLTSLDEDHVSWHGSVSAYHSDKLALFGEAPDSCGVIVPTSESLGVQQLRARALSVLQVDEHEPRLASAVQILRDRGFPGHTARNLACAVNAVELLTGTELAAAELLDIATEHEALPSRHRTVGFAGNIRFIDDALASNPMAAAAALDAVAEPNVAIIVGGTARNVSIEPLVASWGKRPSGRHVIVAVPDNGDELAAAMAAELHGTVVLTAVEMSNAVAVALDAICSSPTGPDTAGPHQGTQNEVGPNGIGLSEVGAVLFAPAAPTPARFGTYVDRAAAFEAAVATQVAERLPKRN